MRIKTRCCRRVTWLYLLSLTLSIAPFFLTSEAAAQIAEGWQKDIDLLIAKIERYHPMPWAKIQKLEFLDKANTLKKNLVNWEKERIFVETMKLVALLQDGHTYLRFTNQERFNQWFPVRIERFADGIFLVATDSLYAEFLGGKIRKIGKVDAEEAFQRIAEIVPKDSEHGIDRCATDYLANALILKHLDVIDDQDRLELIILTANGTEKRVGFASAKWQMWFHWSWNKTSVPTNLKTLSIFDDRMDKLPLYLKNMIPSRIPYLFTYLPEDRMLYFQYNAVNNWRRDPFADFTQRMFKTFDDNVSNIDKFVIDLRFNEGGNGYLLPPLVKEFVIREKSFEKCKLYIITGNHTFSAAPNLIGQMLQSTNVVTVGDIAAGPLNWCSDVVDFLLPNSKVVVDISTMYWQRGHATDNRGYYPPDCYLPMTFKDYVACADPVLDAIKNGTVLSLKQIILDKGVDAFLAEIDRRKNLYGNVEKWFPYTSFNLVLTTYFDLKANGKVDDALKLAKWNTELHPNDFRAWYGLAEIANETENIKEAMEAYKKMLAIEPDISEAIGNYNLLTLMNVCENKNSSELANVVENMKKKDPLSVTERMLNDLGYRFIGGNKIREAIRIFELNVKLYPTSANVYDSLGEAYLKADEKELARKNYERALSLDPNSTSAKQALKELSKK